MGKVTNEIPRRNRLDLNTTAELAIYNATQEVEKLGADPRLTDIVCMLIKAKELLSDFVDSKVGNNNEDEKWHKAYGYLQEMKQAYTEIGFAGNFALNNVIRPLLARCENGEKSEELYKAIFEVK